MFEQQRDILFSVSEGRELYFYHIETVEKVFSELIFIDEFFNVRICCGDDPSVHFYSFGASQLHEFLFLHHSEEFCLSFQVKRRYFIKEDTPFVCSFEQTFFLADSSCESSFDMSEKVAF
jgi:hypothetical protein